MVNDVNFPERLLYIIKKYHFTSSSFAELIGVQRSSISHLLSGRNKPSLDFVVKVMENFPDINFEWLVKGNGEAFSGEKIDIKSTPTLFDQDVEEYGKIKNPLKENTSKSGLIKTDSKDKVIEKIILLYNDGSFESYIQ